MKYKEQCLKLEDKLAKLINLAYTIISDIRIDDIEQGDKLNEELQKIIKG